MSRSQKEWDKIIKRRKAQIARLSRNIKALSTRLKTAKRSLGAIERAYTKSDAALAQRIKSKVGA